MRKKIRIIDYFVQTQISCRMSFQSILALEDFLLNSLMNTCRCWPCLGIKIHMEENRPEEAMPAQSLHSRWGDGL